MSLQFSLPTLTAVPVDSLQPVPIGSLQPVQNTPAPVQNTLAPESTGLVRQVIPAMSMAEMIQVNWKTFTRDDLYILSDDPQEEYKSRRGQEKSTIKWNQRSNALALLSFINLYWKPEENPNPVFIYVGPTDTSDINFVATLYPQIQWHIYNPGAKKIRFPSTVKVKKHSQLFDDTMAQSWVGKDVYFIVNIRSGDATDEGTNLKDLRDQQHWVQIIKPLVALLRFRLPYPTASSTSMSYLAGLVYKQPWLGPSSTDTKLVVTRGQIKNEQYAMYQWDLKKYEGQMYYHNSVTRENDRFFNPFNTPETTGARQEPFPPELNNQWDSLAELTILQDYLYKNKLFNQSTTPENQINLIDGANRIYDLIGNLNQLLTTMLESGQQSVQSLSQLRTRTR